MNTPAQGRYGAYGPQSSHRSPHTTAPRRGPGPMVAAAHHQQAQSTAQIQAQQAAAAQERELAKRRSRKPTDKNIPDGVDEFVIGDGVQRYKALREVERRLDAAMLRKRLDLQESANRNIKRYRTLRIWISNTVDNQPWQDKGLDENAFDFTTGLDGSFKVKIEGRLLDEDDDAEGSNDLGDDSMKDDQGPDQNPTLAESTVPVQKKLSHFFKSITVDFDRDKTMSADIIQQVDWKKPIVPRGTPNLPPSADFDCLEFERKGDENMNVTINLVRDDSPERFRLSKELAEVLDMEEAERATAVAGIWEYIKARGLQEDEEKRSIRCDDRLKAVFKQDQVFFPQIPDMMNEHLLPLPPIALPYTIRVDPEFHASPTPTIYDVRVTLDDPLHARLETFVNDPQYTVTLREIVNLDDQLAAIIQYIAYSKARHTFFTSMSKDPIKFVRRWIGSQKRDLDFILGDGIRGGDEDNMSEEWRRGGPNGIWAGENVRESVGLMLATGRR